MQKRVIALLLVVFGLLAIAGVLYWTFAPSFKKPAPTAPAAPAPVQEPTPLPSLPPPASPSNTPAPRAPTSEDQEQLLLRQRALQFAARQGSYTNADGFASIQDVYLDVTPTVRSFYQAERDRWIKEHPAAVGPWTQTLRALSSRITSELPLGGKTQATVSVQAQQTIEANAQPAVVSYQEIIITFTRDQGRWLVSRVETKPLDL